MRRCRFVLLAVASTGAVLVAGCSSSGPGSSMDSKGIAASVTAALPPLFPSDNSATDADLPTDLPSYSEPPPPMITYRITGNGSHSSTVTYVEDGNDIEQDTNARLPWKKTVDGSASFFSVSAQDSDGTSITCTITDQDGTVLDQKTAHGLYAIASCQTEGD